MMIDCPSCATSYHVSQTAIGAGRAVVCPRCAAQWFVRGVGVRDVAPTVQASAHAPEPKLRPVPKRDPKVTQPVPQRIWCAALVALALCSVALAMNGPLMPYVPAAATLAARLGLRPSPTQLALRGVAGTRADDAETTTLAVRGEISNPHRTAAGVPDLALSISDAAGHEVYRWTAPPPVRKLAAGATASFSIELPRVPAAGHAVAVRFAAVGRP